MAFPAGAVLAPLVGLLVRAFTFALIAKVGWFILRAFAFLGIALTTYQLLVEPLITNARNAWSGMPAELLAWVGLFGLDKVVTILLSAYGIAAVKRVFFTKADA